MTTTDIITNSGKKVILNRSYKAVPDYTAPSQIELGMNQATPNLSTTSITRPIPISGAETIDNCEAITGWTASTSDSVTLNTAIVVNGGGSLNLIKGSIVAATASAYKTTPSLNFTSKTVFGNVYISSSLYALLEATGVAFSFRFGSDASNYYRYNLTKADLVSGNNVFYFTTATATATVGTPTITACVYTLISYTTALVTTTTADSDFVFDNLILASNANYLRNFVATYPTFDYINNEVTIRVYVALTEANGYNFNSFGILNTDGTPLLTDITVFPDESKSQTDEFIFVKKDRIL